GGGDSLYAMHFVGTNCTGWGAQAGFRLKANGSYDASDFDGIAFWARLGSEGAPRPLRVELADVSTHPDGGLCVEVDPEPGEDCFAHYFTNKQLNADPSFWTFFKIPFTEFGAPGFGYHQTDEPQPDKLYQILFKWQPSASANFDVWIDDVYFYKEP